MGEDAKRLRKGDKVKWRSHGTTVHGTALERMTKRSEAAGREVAASPVEPQYRVAGDKSGGDAVQKPGSLERDCVPPVRRPRAEDGQSHRLMKFCPASSRA